MGIHSYKVMLNNHENLINFQHHNPLSYLKQL